MSAVPTVPILTLPDDEPAARRALAEIAAEVEARLDRLPPPGERSEEERDAAEAAKAAAHGVRAGFMARYPATVHAELTDGGRHALSLSNLVGRAALAFPGLVPAPDRTAAEQARPLAAKEGHDVEHGILFGGLLADRVAGQHLMDAMLQPTGEALAALPEFARTGVHARRSVRLERRDGVAHLTMERPDCLNSEDEDQVTDMEVAVDLALLDPAVQVGVLRGGVMTHPRYAGRRVFSSGINLKALHAGRITLVGYLLRRELGFVRKLMRGVRDEHASWPFGVVQKPWLAAVEEFALGGGAQLLLVMDRVVAASDSYLSLPAAQEGIVPGAANLRLAAVAGARVSRQLVLQGRRIWAHEPDARLFFDDVVDSDGMDAAIEAGAAGLAAPAVAANRRLLNLALEPDEAFRGYLAEFAVQQAIRLHSQDVLGKVRAFVGRGRGSA